MFISAAFVCLILASAALVYLTYMDMRYFLLPNWGNLALGLSGIAYHATSTIDWSNANEIGLAVFNMILGAALGAGIFLFTRWVSLKWKGVEGIGWGDVKFSAAAGIWLGPAGIGFMIGGAAAVLLLYGAIVIAITRRPLQDFYLPFGAAAAPATLLILWAQYAGWLSL